MGLSVTDVELFCATAETHSTIGSNLQILFMLHSCFGVQVVSWFRIVARKVGVDLSAIRKVRSGLAYSSGNSEHKKPPDSANPISAPEPNRAFPAPRPTQCLADPARRTSRALATPTEKVQ